MHLYANFEMFVLPYVNSAFKYAFHITLSQTPKYNIIKIRNVMVATTKYNNPKTMTMNKDHMIIKISKAIMITTMCNNVRKQVGVQASMSKLRFK